MTQLLPSGAERAYIRFVSLGDSATCGLGDTVHGRLRGWSRILLAALQRSYHVSYCNLAVSGSTIDDVQQRQLNYAISHRPHPGSLIVGLNDTLRPDWDPRAAGRRLLQTADRLHRSGAVLLTVAFHDHARVFGLPGFLARRLAQRIEQLNEIYGHIHREYDSVHVDLRAEPAVYRREFWSADRLHPSDLGHRLLALRFAELLDAHGPLLDFPRLCRNGDCPSLVEKLGSLASAGAPWLARRLRDWVPALLGKACSSDGDLGCPLRVPVPRAATRAWTGMRVAR